VWWGGGGEGGGGYARFMGCVLWMQVSAIYYKEGKVRRKEETKPFDGGLPLDSGFRGGLLG